MNIELNMIQTIKLIEHLHIRIEELWEEHAITGWNPTATAAETLEEIMELLHAEPCNNNAHTEE